MIENVLTCDDCKQAALDVEVISAPGGFYNSDDDGVVSVKLCDACYELRCDEI